MKNKRKELKRLIDEERTIHAPAVYDCIGAMVAEDAGFKMLFTGGFGISASLYGLPDLGYLTATEMLDAAERITRSVSIPVISDMDTGYGGPLNVIKLVEGAIKADIAGIILEDQIWPKRCGHLRGKQVVDAKEYLEKLKAADYARRGEDFTIVARTDALSVMGLDEALRRGEMYLKSGADVLFVESPTTVQELQRIADNFRGENLMVNIIEGGKTPELSVRELEEMGFKLVAFALTTLFTVTSALKRSFFELLSTGKTGKGTMSFDDINNLLKTEEHISMAEKFSAIKRDKE